MAAKESGSEAPPAGTMAGKYLTFHLATEEYAVEVIKVREIMGVLHITRVPQTPSEVKGVINLRGKVIPVIDLRIKFGLPETEYTQRTCIIVVQLSQSGTQMGIIVDEVSEVLNLTANDIQKTPDFGTGIELPHLLGMAKVKGKVKILLDIDRVLTSQEIQSLAGMFKQ
ncbi:MAG: purine-binding chemotaxis protein CheW [Acidimicrobiia bacterium]|nr:purine-binding chemotaxis protein CheW [Acidimicrobiia bacterium]